MYKIYILLVFGLTTTYVYSYEFILEGFHKKKSGSVDMSMYVHELFQCSVECVSSHECCVATYYTDNNTCSFSSCCFHYQGNIVEPSSIRMIKATKLVDCSDLACGTNISGMYDIFPGVQSAVEIHCYFGENNIPWTIIQQRLYGDVDFTRNWEDYKVGFGSATTDYWIGDALIVSNGVNFSTYDIDNDALINVHCGERWKGGWWYYRCGQCNPNGPFSQVEIVDQWWTMHWNKWRYKTQLKTIIMKITPVM